MTAQSLLSRVNAACDPGSNASFRQPTSHVNRLPNTTATGQPNLHFAEAAFLQFPWIKIP